MQQLQNHELVANTIVVFTSDNGPTHGSQNKNWHVGGAGCKFFNSNGGLRGYKGSCYEGGIRIPCVVSWPGKVAPGGENHEPSYFPDWFPTLASIGHGKLPEQQLLDGIDLTNTLQGGSIAAAR